MVVETSSEGIGAAVGGGRVVLETTAPQAAVAFARLVEVRPVGVHDELLKAPAVRAFAAAFRTDVSAIDEQLRAGFMQATGRHQTAVAHMVWIGDLVPRGRAALDALFGPSVWEDPRRYPVAEPGLVIDDFTAAVARLDALDPTVTELVRLRGARLHGSRLGLSRRSVAALEQGATEADFDAVDHYRDSTLADDARAALALVDAMVRTPDAIPGPTLDAVRGSFDPARSVELVLDVVRNGADKLAVALGSDVAEVTDGVQLFTTESDGTVVPVVG